MYRYERPYGYLTSGDVAQLSPLKGQQVYQLLKEHGDTVNGRLCIKESVFRQLESNRMIDKYRAYPMWSDAVRNSRKPYRREAKKRAVGV